jgi:predicted dienelactone hydrolase
LIVFSPGFDIDPAVYNTLVGRWASFRFVVAVPDYPFTAGGAPGGVNEADIVQHPEDLEATIDELIVVSSSSGTLLTRMIDPSRIGVAGHSDGGDVTDAVVSDSCCRDPRIRAAAVLSGAELTSFGGTYGPIRVPLLVVQGDSDTINAPPCSEQIYSAGGAHRFYLALRGAGHLPPHAAGPSGAVYQQAVDRVSALFWTAYLDDDASAASALEARTGVAPPATLTAGGPVAQIGNCPGAP